MFHIVGFKTCWILFWTIFEVVLRSLETSSLESFCFQKTFTNRFCLSTFGVKSIIYCPHLALISLQWIILHLCTCFFFLKTLAASGIEHMHCSESIDCVNKNQETGDDIIFVFFPQKLFKMINDKSHFLLLMIMSTWTPFWGMQWRMHHY